MTPRLVYVGLTHQSAPLAIRENVRVDAQRLRTLLSRLGALADGRLVLGTCERFEIYATMRHSSVTEWAAMLSQWFHVPAALLEPRLRMLEGASAAEHLLRVAAGLESRIVGEAQILGQVRDAFQAALDMNALDAELSAVARAAIRAGKRVRHETSLGAGARSIATITLDALAKECNNACEPTVAVVGTGRLAEVVLSELRRRAMGNRIVVGRDLARVQDLALRFEASAEPMSRMGQVSSLADAVVVCTAAPTYVLDAAALAAVRSRPLWIFDLSVPRNVDPMVATISAIRLLHLDQLVRNGGLAQEVEIDNRQSAIGNRGWPVARAPGSETRGEGPIIRTPSASAGSWPVARAPGSDEADAERIVAEELQRFVAWRRERRAAPLIAQLVREMSSACERDKSLLHQHILRLKAEAAA